MQNKNRVPVNLEDGAAKEKEQREIDALPKWSMITADDMATKYDKYRDFMDHYAPRLADKDEYYTCLLRKTPDQWLTPEMEAFGLLLLQNYEESIDASLRNLKKPTKWTLNGTAKKNQGWKTDAIDEYNSILKHVKNYRRVAAAQGNSFRDRYLAEKVEWDNAKKCRGKIKKELARQEREKGYSECCTDGLDELMRSMQNRNITPV